jgi:hypothetical protein
MVPGHWDGSQGKGGIFMCVSKKSLKESVIMQNQSRVIVSWSSGVGWGHQKENHFTSVYMHWEKSIQVSNMAPELLVTCVCI